MVIQQVTVKLRGLIRCTNKSMICSPKPEKLTVDGIQIPDNVKTFFSSLFEKLESEYIKSTSWGQELMFGVTGGRVKSPQHLLLPYASPPSFPTMSISLKQLSMLPCRIVRLNIGNQYLCRQKLALTSENEMSLPS